MIAQEDDFIRIEGFDVAQASGESCSIHLGSMRVGNNDPHDVFLPTAGRLGWSDGAGLGSMQMAIQGRGEFRFASL